MLPSGKIVKSVYLGNEGIIENAPDNILLIDSSTIDVETARDVSESAISKGLNIVDAPVSGGVGGAQAGTLTFMVGGEKSAFDKAKEFLDSFLVMIQFLLDSLRISRHNSFSIYPKKRDIILAEYYFLGMREKNRVFV